MEAARCMLITLHKTHSKASSPQSLSSPGGKYSRVHRTRNNPSHFFILRFASSVILGLGRPASSLFLYCRWLLTHPPSFGSSGQS